MKPSAVLLLAAERVDQHPESYFGCWALAELVTGWQYPNDFIDEFARGVYEHPSFEYFELMRDPAKEKTGPWFSGDFFVDNIRQHRVLALCMAAAIAKSEGR